VDYLCANQVMCVASPGGIQIISATTPFWMAGVTNKHPV